jgi:hypothetical protein
MIKVNFGSLSLNRVSEIYRTPHEGRTMLIRCVKKGWNSFLGGVISLCKQSSRIVVHNY